jgi:hypothetical protein
VLAVVASDEDILARELEKVGALGAEIAKAALGGIEAAEHPIEASLHGLVESAEPMERDPEPNDLQRWVLSRLPTETESVTAEVEQPVEHVLTLALRVLRQEGDLMEDSAGMEVPTLAGVVKAGFMNLNPSIVRVSVMPLGDGASSQFVVSATAKEGLIKQGTAKKAADRVKTHLLDALGQ